MGVPMEQEGFKRKLTAILSADVEGYSRLMGEDEDATILTLTTYRELMSTIIQKHRGRVVDAPGDNLLAEFSSVVDAVRCAVEIQEELRVRNAELPENRRMHFRIGVNLGDVVEEDGRIYGDGVNITARVEGLAEGGGICISGTVYDSIKSKLSLSYESMGEHTVKNITEPVRVFRMRIGPEAAPPAVEKAWPRRWLKPSMAVVVILVVAVGAWAIWNFYFRPPPIEPASVEKMAYQLPENASIAVLPFVNMSGDPKEDYIVDGITESIITGLSKTPKMFVIARNSVFRYKGRPVEIRQVSEELGVRYVLEGSVQKEGDRLRINAQLIDAIKGHHLWAEKYDRELKDLFALQDDVTMKIITELEVKLTEGEFARVSAKGTNKIEAYLKVLKANQLCRTITEGNNILARKMLKDVIALDPNYPMAYILMGWAHSQATYRWSKSPKESLARAEEFIQKALELDESQSAAHIHLAIIYRMKRQLDKALAENERAVALDPNSINFGAMAVNLLISGRFDEAIEMFKRSIRLDPIPQVWVAGGLAYAYFGAGLYEEALETFKQVLKRAKKGEYRLTSPLLGLAMTYAMLGQEEEAQAYIAKLLKIKPKYNIKLFAKKRVGLFKNQEDKNRWIDAVRKAGLPEEPPLPLPDKPSIAVLPFTNMSKDPEQEYFADGMTDDLITDLSKISGLFVIARNSAFKYKGQTVDVKKISRELGVRHVLEGSVRKVLNQVRINAQLIDATTGGHLWAERYDGKMDDIFALQDKITGKIVSALAVKLTEGEKGQLARKGTDNIEAYDAFLKGWGHYLRWTPEDHAKAVSYFKKAVELDPNYGQAYAGLANIFFFDEWRFYEVLDVPWNWREGKLQAREYLQLAMKNPTGLAHRVKADLNLRFRLYDEAIAEAERAIALNPNDPEMQLCMAKVLVFAGRPKEAVDFAKKAMRQDPRYIGFSLLHLGQAHFCMGQFENAVTFLERAVKHIPEYNKLYSFLAASYAHIGRDQEAKAALDNFLGRGVEPILRIIMYRFSRFKYQEVAERFAKGLLKAGIGGELSEYYKLFEENRLTAEEIREVMFGRTRSGFLNVNLEVDITKDGKSSFRGGSTSDVGRVWIEGDMFCFQWEIFYDSSTCCCTVFRNPEGTPEKKNEYLDVCDSGISTWSPVD